MTRDRAVFQLALEILSEAERELDNPSTQVVAYGKVAAVLVLADYMDLRKALSVDEAQDVTSRYRTLLARLHQVRQHGLALGLAVLLSRIKEIWTPKQRISPDEPAVPPSTIRLVAMG